MISLSKIKGRPSISITDITNVVGDEDILAYYFQIYKIPCLINSPLRKDSNPSFSIYYNKNNKLVFHDFGTNESGGIFDMVMKKFNISYADMLYRIYDDMCVLRNSQSIPIIKPKRHKVNNILKLQVRTRSWTNYDLDYWNSYGISQEWLRFGRVFPISDIFIQKNNTTSFNLPADKYAYCFVEFKDDKQSLKIYQPFNLQYKWMNDGDNSIWNLWSQLPPNGDKLIITSSLKDALCLWANLRIPSCCLQSEHTIPKKHVMEQLKNRFDKIYVFYDNDCTKLQNTGQINAKKLVDKYQLINICIDDWYECKDPSDLYKKYGKKQFQKIINKKIWD